MKDNKALNSTVSMKVKDASTNTEGSDAKNVSTSVIDLPYQSKDASISVKL